MAFVGDISLNGAFAKRAKLQPARPVFQGILGLLKDADVVVGNLESPLAGDGACNKDKRVRLWASPEAYALLDELPLDVAVLANNHVGDELQLGMRRTLAFLDAKSVAHVGAGCSMSEASRPLVLHRKGFRVGVLAYAAPDTHPRIPQGLAVHVNTLESSRCLAEVADLRKQCDILIVSVHWGIERFAFPLPQQRSLARALVEAGADVIHGHHAHCLQGHEFYNGGHILYGMGNFAFANVFGTRHVPIVWSQDNRNGMIATLDWRPESVPRLRVSFCRQTGLTVKPDDSRGRWADWQGRCRPLRFHNSRYAAFCRLRLLRHSISLRVKYVFAHPFAVLKKLRRFVAG